MPDDFDRLDGSFQRFQRLIGVLQVDHPRNMTHHGKRQKPDMAPPRVQTIILLCAVRLNVQGNCTRFGDPTRDFRNASEGGDILELVGADVADGLTAVSFCITRSRLAG